MKNSKGKLKAVKAKTDEPVLGDPLETGLAQAKQLLSHWLATVNRLNSELAEAKSIALKAEGAVAALTQVQQMKKPDNKED